MCVHTCTIGDMNTVPAASEITGKTVGRDGCNSYYSLPARGEIGGPVSRTDNSVASGSDVLSTKLSICALSAK